MIVKIRTKGEATGYDTDDMYLWIMTEDSYQIIEEDEIPTCVERSIYENPFIEVYILTA